MIEVLRWRLKLVLFRLKNVYLCRNSRLNWNVTLTDKTGAAVVINRSNVMCKEVGEGVRINDALLLGQITLGRYVSIFGPGTVLSSVMNEIHVGSFTSIGQGVQIQESYHNYHRTTTYLIQKNIFKTEYKKDFISKGPVIIGKDVWIGSNSVILSGVSIGDGSIIGAGSVVTKDVGSFEIWGGNPAVFIKRRFSQEKEDQIRADGWWNWSTNKLLNNRDYFESCR